MEKLFYLIVAHALLDFVFQGDTVAINKNPLAKTELQKHVPWFYWMLSHALAHGGAVAFITHSVSLGIAETCFHFFIDFVKCISGKGRYKLTIHQDQLLHILCKVLYVSLG